MTRRIVFVFAWMLVAPIWAYAQPPVFAPGPQSVAGPGWTWHVFDVSGNRTSEPDLLAYRWDTGDYVLAITGHPQFSGVNGSVVAPGDCYLVGQLPLRRTLTVADLDRDGRPDLFTYDPVTGAITRFYFRSFGGCDWTDAF